MGVDRASAGGGSDRNPKPEVRTRTEKRSSIGFLLCGCPRGMLKLVLRTIVSRSDGEKNRSDKIFMMIVYESIHFLQLLTAVHVQVLIPVSSSFTRQPVVL